MQISFEKILPSKQTRLAFLVRLVAMLPLYALFLLGCEEIIEFDTNNKGGDLVVFGRVTNGTEGNEVTVSLTSPFDRPSTPIQFANVSVLDEEGNREIFRETTDPGTYRSENPVLDRSTGKKFYLEVCTPNGKMYRSAVEAMPKLVGEDSVYFNVETERFVTDNAQEVEQTVINVLLDAEIERNGNEPVFLRWDVEEVYAVQEVMLPSNKFPLWIWNTCYITNPVDAQKFFVFNGDDLTNDEISNFSLAKRPLDGSFFGKHYFNVFRYSLSFESFDYWRKVNQLTDRVGSIFDSPPATQPSNNRNVENPDEVVFGHIEVVARATSRFLVTKNDIPVVFDGPCELPPEINDVPFNCFSCLQEIFALKRECLNCSILKNSSGVRPDYF